MTAQDLLRVMLRRWYVILLGAVITVALGVSAVQRPGVYWTQYEAVLLPPIERVNPNNLTQGPYGLTPMAGLIVADYNQGRQPLQLSSSATTLYGEGIRRGERVRLRNAGTQWRPSYVDPVIDVQVVGQDRTTVQERAEQISERLRADLEVRQDDLAVEPAARMSMRMTPADPVTVYVGPARARALLAIGVLGATLTILLTLALEHWLRKRSRTPA